MNQHTTSDALIITRDFVAPRALVWKAWTDPDALAEWWGPKNFAIKVAKFDFRPGGVFHYSMATSEGKHIWGKFVYREIQHPERIIYVNCFSDEHGGLTRNPWIPVWPLENLNTLTLTEKDGKTTLTIRGGPINASEEETKNFVAAKSSMEAGFAGTFEQLDAWLAKQQAAAGTDSELIISRTFDAPRNRVWKAWTDPMMLVKWWAPKQWTTPHYTADFRVGGKYLFCMKGTTPEGKVLEVWATGIYKEIIPLERIVCTDSFSDKHGNVVPASHYGMGDGFSLEALVTVEFKEVGGKTEMTLRHEGLPNATKADTNNGWNEMFDKLNNLLKAA